MRCTVVEANGEPEWRGKQTASEIKLQTSVAYLNILAKKHTSRYYTAMHRRRDVCPHQCEEKPSSCHATSTVLGAEGTRASAARGEVEDHVIYVIISFF